MVVGDHMNIKQASSLLNIPEQSLRLWLRSGHCPFGDAFQGTGKAFRYYICEERLNAYITGKLPTYQKDCAGSVTPTQPRSKNI